MEETSLKLLSNIDIDRALFENKGQISMASDLEEALILLYHLKKKIEEAEERIKNQIIEAGLKISSEFKGVFGSRMKATYQAAGPKYGIDSALISSISPEFIEMKHLPNTKAIDAYWDRFQAMPQGIICKNRKKILAVTIKKPASKNDKEEEA